MTIFTPLRAASAGLAFVATSLLSAPASADIIHTDDVIIEKNTLGGVGLCVGNSCADGESFGSDSIRLKEESVRLHFDDCRCL